MKVKAKQILYYNNRRYREGAVFHLKDKKHFSEISMEKVGKAKKEVDPEVEVLEDDFAETVSNQEVI